MKAKDYADKFPEYQEKFKKDYPDPDELVIRCAMELCVDMLDEMDTIRKKRHVTTNGGYTSIIEEMRVKWKAIVARLNQPLIRDDFFNMFMEEHLPSHWGLKKQVDHVRSQRFRVGSHRY